MLVRYSCLHRLAACLLAFCCLGMTVISPLVQAAIDEYEFSSDEEQARFRKLADEMRCPKCLNSNLSGSDAPIAADLRAEIYEQVKEGRSNQEIEEFMRARYGDFIMYRPPFNTGTLLLWLGPGVLLIAGFIILRRVLKTSAVSETSGQLSEEEQAELDEILNRGDR